MPKLTPKQRKFANEYLVDHNATQACIRAGYAQKAAGQQGYDLLNRPHIAEYIQRKEVQYDDRYWLVNVLRRMVRGEESTKTETRYYQNKDGEVRPYDSEACDKLRAIEMLAKIEGLVVEKVEHAGEARLLLDMPGMLNAEAKRSK